MFEYDVNVNVYPSSDLFIHRWIFFFVADTPSPYSLSLLSFHEQNREICVYASTFYNLIVLLNLLIIVDRIGEQGSTDERP